MREFYNANPEHDPTREFDPSQELSPEQSEVVYTDLKQEDIPPAAEEDQEEVEQTPLTEAEEQAASLARAAANTPKVDLDFDDDVPF